jgi:cellulose synthase/poly-beta-1,6-N-acetylglucosamine synthase-like glycosyltransferase
VTVIVALVLAPFFLLTLCFAVEVFVGLRPLPDTPVCAGPVPAIVIVPAHNEAHVLDPRLRKLKEAADGGARILLVADNCTDSTAAIARDVGVEVVERFDPDRRGKGFALYFARACLSKDPPAVVLIVDADCAMDHESLQMLILSCAATGRPCQATNLQIPSDSASPTVQLSTFAFFIKNVIRQRALQRLTGRVNLLGTGMGLPWPIFAVADLATGNLVEDLKLGQELAERGYAPLFVERATVLSSAESDSNTLSQRSRWEGGFLQNAIAVGPHMFARSLVRADMQGLWAAMNTMIPPVALLILLDLVALTIAATVALLANAGAWPILALVAALLLAATALGFAWRAGGSRYVSLKALSCAPFYIAWKLPMYLAFVRRGVPVEWRRTDRT